MTVYVSEIHISQEVNGIKKCVFIRKNWNIIYEVISDEDFKENKVFSYVVLEKLR